MPLALLVMLGAARYLFDLPPADPALPFGPPVDVRGEIAAPPAVMGSTVRCLLRSVTIARAGIAERLDGMLLTTIRRRSGEARKLCYGDLIDARGNLARPPVRRNPGEFNLRRFYEGQGVTGLLLVRDGRTLKVVDSTGGSFLMKGVVFPLRSTILSSIDSTVGGQEGEFLKGLLLGERSGLPVTLKEAFVISGVAHILAVSGSNVAVVAGAAILALMVLRCPRRIRPWVISAVLVAYMLLTGNQPPVVRATIMALIFLWSATRQERSDPYNVIGLAALVILAIDPRQLFDVGFQLSFVAVLSLIHIFPRLRSIYAAVGGAAWYRRLALAGLDLVALTLAATLGTLPITAAVFGRVSVIGLLANVVVVPASGLGVLLGMVTVATSIASPWLGGVYGETLRLVLSLTLRVVEVAGNIPYAAIESYGFAAADAIPFYAALALAVHFRSAPVARRLVLVLAAAMVLWTALPRAAVPAHTRSSVRLTVLDVGQGDALLLQFPDGATMLVDAGPAGVGGDAGSKVIVPYLGRLGIGRIDLLVVSHAHDDHTGGLYALTRAVPVGNILVPNDTAARVLPPHLRVRARVVSRGDSLSIGGARVYVLAPLAQDSSGATNESSIVLKVAYGRSSMILAGDEPADLERSLIATYGGFLHADFLKVGHHGSGTSTSEELLDAVRPRYAAMSVGRFNRHGHPSPDVVRRLEERDILVGRTDDDGALMYEVTCDTLAPLQWQ